MTISQNILLTGAGFSQNFGGFLSEQMWSHIFNHPEVQSRTTIRKLLLENFDYESIYYRVLLNSSNRYDDVDKSVMNTAVLKAYERIDALIVNHLRQPEPDYEYAVKSLINHFSGDMKTTGIIFTLNQDIFIERFYDQTSVKPLALPGAQRIPAAANSNRRRCSLAEDDFITIAAKSSLLADDLSRSELHYIKLHGSFNWRSSDGSNIMVIGEDKKDTISREPLLTRYLEIFRTALSQKNRRLLTIGYSFRDKHINEIIANAVKEYGMKLYAVSLESPRNFVEQLLNGETFGHPFGKEICEGLSGYFPYTLEKLLEADQFKLLNEQYFLEN